MQFFLRFWLFAKAFSRKNKPYFEFAKSIPKISKRESFCQKFCAYFFGTRKFRLAKFSTLNVVNRVDNLKITLILQNEMLLFINYKAVKAGINSTKPRFIINCCSITFVVL